MRSQEALSLVAKSYRFGIRSVVSDMPQYLRSDPNITHEQFKVRSYVLCARKEVREMVTGSNLCVLSCGFHVGCMVTCWSSHSCNRQYIIVYMGLTIPHFMYQFRGMLAGGLGSLPFVFLCLIACT